MQLRSTRLLLGAALCVVPALTQAQPAAHYVPGVEGIKAASLPPPGVYLRDYNVLFYSDRLNDSSGHEVTGLDPRALVYANVPRLIWITPLQVLGGNIGVDALLPLQYTSLRLTGLIDDHTFGIGDAFAEATWSTHLKQFDLSLGYGAWAPTGDFSTGPVTTLAGLGYWTHMFTAGATWYPDADKKWALSVLHRYEINMKKDDVDLTPGQAWTVEGGLSHTLFANCDVGVVGYYQRRVTADTGAAAAVGHPYVAGIGPEVSLFCPPCGLNTSLRYIYEFLADDRLQGHTVALTLTKRF